MKIPWVYTVIFLMTRNELGNSIGIVLDDLLNSVFIVCLN